MHKLFRIFLYVLFILISCLPSIAEQTFNSTSYISISISIFVVMSLETLYKKKNKTIFFALILNRIIVSTIYINDSIVSSNSFELATQLNIYEIATKLYNANILLAPFLVAYFLYMFLIKQEANFKHIVIMLVVFISPNVLWSFDSIILLQNLLKFQFVIHGIIVLGVIFYFKNYHVYGTQNLTAHLLVILSFIYSTLVAIKSYLELIDINIAYLHSIIYPILFLSLSTILTSSHQSTGQFFFNTTFKTMLIVIGLALSVYFRNDQLILIQSIMITGCLLIELFYSLRIRYRDILLNNTNGGRA